MAGYSGTPLVKKLGIKPGFEVAFVSAPKDFVQQLKLPTSVNIKSPARSEGHDLIVVFVRSQTELALAFDQYLQKMKPNGMFWVSWPKKSSGVVTDVNENIVRAIGLAAGLVDVKVCAVDEVWSGLKFVFRLRDRPHLKASQS